MDFFSIGKRISLVYDSPSTKIFAFCYFLYTIGGVADTKPIPVRLDDKLIARLDTAAERMGTNRAALIRFLTQSFLTHFEQAGGVTALPHNWEQILREQDGRTYGQTTNASTPKKSAVKRKSTRLRDIESVSLAVYNEVGAGPALMPSARPVDYVKVRRGRFSEDAFAVRSRGNSMKGAGVRDGGLVVLRWVEHQEARPDDIVCVHLYGEGSVLKQLKERRGKRWLVSRNPASPDICLDCDGDPKGRIQAVMVGKL